MHTIRVDSGVKFKFCAGEILVTDSVAELMQTQHADAIRKCLDRHFQGDWGEADEDCKLINDEALLDGGSLMSVYEVSGETIWVITDGRNSGSLVITTVMRPQEY